jgi:hypothetical protein
LDDSAPAAATSTLLRAEGALLSPVLIALGSSMREDTDVSGGYVDFGTVTEDEDVTAMDHSSVDRMLKHSVRPSTLAKYSRLWDKWASFSALHEVETVPPDMRALEIFIVNCAELAGPAGVENSTAAAVAHFTALEGWPSPFTTPRLSKILRGICNSYGKAAKPKKPFLRSHIILFMDMARKGSLLDWRAALPLALCYQQLLRGAEAFDLKGSNIVRHPEYFLIEVESAKNNPDGFSFKVPVDARRSNCVGQFLADFLVRMGIVLGNEKSYISCKISTAKGVMKDVPLVRVGDSTMRLACKRLIGAVGLDSRDYASHSCKRGGALAAMEAGLSHSQIQDLGRWASASMVGRYAAGDPVAREAASEIIRI